MAKRLQNGGWFLAILMILLCAFLTNRLLHVESELKETQTLIVALNNDLAAVSVAPETDALESKIKELEGALVEARESVDKAPMAANDPEQSVAEAPDEEAPETDATKEDSPDGPSQRERIMKAQRSLMTDMVYKELFQELNLSPALTAQLKDAIAASMGEQQELVQKAMLSKNRTAKAVRTDRDALRAALREKLTDTLTPQELAAYDDYELVADQILLEKTVDSQLGALAAGLTAENRLLTSQVMAEELVREFDLFDQTEETYSLDTFNEAQARGLQATMDRLSGTLTEDQLGQVQGFVDQALAMFDAMSDGGGA